MKKCKLATTYRLSPNEEALVLQQETERRRKIRIQQVRERERAFARLVRQQVQVRKKQELRILSGQLEQEWLEAKLEKEEILHEVYRKNLEAVGTAHTSARGQPPLDEMRERATVERAKKAKERGQRAVQKQQEEDEERVQGEFAHIMARKTAMEIERARAALVAKRPSRQSDVDEVSRPGRVQESSRVLLQEGLSTTHYTVAAEYAEKAENPQEQGDAKKSAVEEERRLKEETMEKQDDLKERQAKAALRQKHAQEKERLERDRNQLMGELGQMEQSDRRRRQLVVSNIPKQIFQPPHKRIEEKADNQKDLEQAFENMYMADTDCVGDLELVLEPTLPQVTGDLDVSSDTPGEEFQRPDKREPKTWFVRGLDGDLRKPVPAKKDTLKNLLQKIHCQKQDHNVRKKAEVAGSTVDTLPMPAFSISPGVSPSVSSSGVAATTVTADFTGSGATDSQSSSQLMQHPLSTEDGVDSRAASDGTVSLETGTISEDSLMAGRVILMHPLERAKRLRGEQDNEGIRNKVEPSGPNVTGGHSQGFVQLPSEPSTPSTSTCTTDQPGPKTLDDLPPKQAVARSTGDAPKRGYGGDHFDRMVPGHQGHGYSSDGTDGNGSSVGRPPESSDVCQRGQGKGEVGTGNVAIQGGYFVDVSRTDGRVGMREVPAQESERRTRQNLGAVGGEPAEDNHHPPLAGIDHPGITGRQGPRKNEMGVERNSGVTSSGMLHADMVDLHESGSTMGRLSPGRLESVGKKYPNIYETLTGRKPTDREPEEYLKSSSSDDPACEGSSVMLNHLNYSRVESHLARGISSQQGESRREKTSTTFSPAGQRTLRDDYSREKVHPEGRGEETRIFMDQHTSDHREGTDSPTRESPADDTRMRRDPGAEFQSLLHDYQQQLLKLQRTNESEILQAQVELRERRQRLLKLYPRLQSPSDAGPDSGGLRAGGGHMERNTTQRNPRDGGGTGEPRHEGMGGVWVDHSEQVFTVPSGPLVTPGDQDRSGSELNYGLSGGLYGVDRAFSSPARTMDSSIPGLTGNGPALTPTFGNVNNRSTLLSAGHEANVPQSTIGSRSFGTPLDPGEIGVGSKLAGSSYFQPLSPRFSETEDGGSQSDSFLQPQPPEWRSSALGPTSSQGSKVVPGKSRQGESNLVQTNRSSPPGELESTERSIVWMPVRQLHVSLPSADGAADQSPLSSPLSSSFSTDDDSPFPSPCKVGDGRQQGLLTPKKITESKVGSSIHPNQISFTEGIRRRTGERSLPMEAASPGMLITPRMLLGEDEESRRQTNISREVYKGQLKIARDKKLLDEVVHRSFGSPQFDVADALGQKFQNEDCSMESNDDNPPSAMTEKNRSHMHPLERHGSSKGTNDVQRTSPRIRFLPGLHVSDDGEDRSFEPTEDLSLPYQSEGSLMYAGGSQRERAPAYFSHHNGLTSGSQDHPGRAADLDQRLAGSQNDRRPFLDGEAKTGGSKVEDEVRRFSTRWDDQSEEARSSEKSTLDQSDNILGGEGGPKPAEGGPNFEGPTDRGLLETLKDLMIARARGRVPGAPETGTSFFGHLDLTTDETRESLPQPVDDCEYVGHKMSLPMVDYEGETDEVDDGGDEEGKVAGKDGQMERNKVHQRPPVAGYCKLMEFDAEMAPHELSTIIESPLFDTLPGLSSIDGRGASRSEAEVVPRRSLGVDDGSGFEWGTPRLYTSASSKSPSLDQSPDIYIHRPTTVSSIDEASAGNDSDLLESPSRTKQTDLQTDSQSQQSSSAKVTPSNRTLSKEFEGRGASPVVDLTLYEATDEDVTISEGPLINSSDTREFEDSSIRADELSLLSSGVLRARDLRAAPHGSHRVFSLPWHVGSVRTAGKTDASGLIGAAADPEVKGSGLAIPLILSSLDHHSLSAPYDGGASLEEGPLDDTVDGNGSPSDRQGDHPMVHTQGIIRIPPSVDIGREEVSGATEGSPEDTVGTRRSPTIPHASTPSTYWSRPREGGELEEGPLEDSTMEETRSSLTSGENPAVSTLIPQEPFFGRLDLPTEYHGDRQEAASPAGGSMFDSRQLTSGSSAGRIFPEVEVHHAHRLADGGMEEWSQQRSTEKSEVTSDQTIAETGILEEPELTFQTTFDTTVTSESVADEHGRGNFASDSLLSFVKHEQQFAHSTPMKAHFTQSSNTQQTRQESSELMNDNSNNNISGRPLTLQEALAQHNARFIKASQTRQAEVKAYKDTKPKPGNAFAVTLKNWQKSKLQAQHKNAKNGVVKNPSMGNKENRDIGRVTAPKAKTSRDRKAAQKADKDRTKRLYNQLEEVQHRQIASKRQKEYAENREKRKEYEEKMKQRRIMMKMNQQQPQRKT